MAQSGNGIDLGTVYHLLVGMSARLDSMDAQLEHIEGRLDSMDGRIEHVVGRVDHISAYGSARLDSHDRKLDQLLEIANAHSRILCDHTRQLDDLNAGVTELRSTVGGYHEAVVSQGMHYSELDGRVRRVERHLKLEPGGG